MTTSFIKNFWFFPLLGLLISCQKGTAIKKTAYQTAANKQIASMVKKTDFLVKTATKTRGATGVRLIGNFDLYGMNPYGGQFLPNNVDQVSAQFFQMMQEVNGAMTNEQAYAAGVRAVNTIFNYGNPGVVANQYLDQYSQQGLAYLQAYTVPGATYSNFAGNTQAISSFMPYTNSGYFQGLLY